METSAQTKKSINWKNVLIGVAIGAILIGGGVLIWFLFQPKPTPTASTPTKKATPSAETPTPSTQKDETAGWKTYQTEIGKFSLKYSPTFTLSENKPAAEKWSIVLKSSDFNLVLGGACPFPNVTQGAFLEVAVEHVSGAKNTLSEIVDFERKAPSVDKPVVSTEASLTLDGRDAAKFTYTGVNDKYGCNSPSKSQTSEVVWAVNKDGVDYSLRIYYFNQGKENFETLFNQILSTFRFD